MDQPNPFNAALQVPDDVQSFIWPSGSTPPKEGGAGVPQANPLGADNGPVPINPLDLPPTPAPAAQGDQGAPPAPAPLPLPSPPEINAPAASAEANGPVQPVDDLEQRLAQADTEHPDDLESRLRAADVIQPEHTAGENWRAGFTDRLLGVIGTAGSYLDKTDVFERTMAEAAKRTLEAKGDPSTEEYRKHLQKVIDEEPGSILKDIARDLGVNTTPDKGSLAGEIGSQTVDGLLFLAGTALMAPVAGGAAAAINLPRVAGFITRMGAAIRANPVLATLSEVLGATPGAVIGEYKLDSPLGAIPGAIIGGSAFDAGRRLLQTGLALPQGIAAKLSDVIFGSRNNPTRRFNESTNEYMFGEPKLAPSSTPIHHANDPAHFLDHVKDVLDSATMAAVQKGEAAIAKIKQTAHTDPRRYSVAVFKGLEKAEEFFNKQRARYWSQVDQDTIVKGGARKFVIKSVQDLRQEIAGKNEYFRPDTLIDELWNMAAKGAKTTTGEYISFANRLFHAQKSEEGAILAGRMPRQEFIATINKMRDIAYDAISRALPGDNSLALARAFSQRYHDIFSRGTLGRVGATNRLGEQGVQPEATMDYITKRFNGFKDLLDNTRRMMNEPPAPGQRISTANITPRGSVKAATGTERQQLIETRKAASDAIRAQVRQDIAEKGFDQTQALRIMRNAEQAVPHMAAVATDLKRAIPQLAEALQEQAVIKRGAFARVVGTNFAANPEQAVSRVFREGAPLARELMVSLRSDPNALDHLRQSLVSEVLRRSAGKPGELDTLLKSEHVRRLFNTVMDRDTHQRINRVADVVTRIEKGDIKLAGKYWVTPTILASRLGGAWFGRTLGSMTGASTIQAPGIMSQAFKKVATEAMGKLSKPEVMLAKAMTDPHWEAFILSHDPSTAQGGKRLIKTVQRLTKYMEGARQATDPLSNPITEQRRMEQR